MQIKLASDVYGNLSKITYVDNKRKEYNILFSIVAGEKSTYKLVGNSAEVFGKHSENYLDLYGIR